MLSFGFYNSKGGDRKYDAEQFGAMFNGIITDGVFAHYKNALKVTAGDGNRELVVSSGRAWFNGTWTEVDDNGHSIYLMGSAVETTYFVYLAVDKNSRKNSVAWYSSIMNNIPEKGLYFYLLAQATIPGGVNKITDAMITDTRGSDLCPYVTGIMETVSFEDLVKRVCGENWQDWLGVYEAGITTGVQNAVRASSEALSEVKSLKAYSVESEAVSYTWAKFEAIATGGGGFEWATDSVHTELADPPMPVYLFRDLSYADLGAGFKPSISLGSPYKSDGEATTKPVPASTQAKVWKEYPYFWEGGGEYGTEVLRYDDLQRVIVTTAGVATDKYRYRVSRLAHLPVTYEPGAYIGTVTADNATAYPRDGYKDGYWYMRFAAKAEDVSFYYPGLSAKNVRDAIIEVVRTGGTGGGSAMSIIEVEELPATGISGVMYVVKKPGDTDAAEYLWLDRWEKIGGTGSGQNVDLSGYAEKTWVQEGFQPKGTAESAVSAHNANNEAHPDIRLEIKAIREQLAAFLDVDEETLNELSELIARIVANQTSIAQLTTNKVNVADIIDNLTTNVTNKPLSAAQGVAIKALVDGLASGKLDASKLSEAINTALAQAKASGEFDGAKGDPGRGIKSIARTSGNGAAGTTDTYTITYTDNTTDTFTVRNGSNGAPGQAATLEITSVTALAPGAAPTITEASDSTAQARRYALAIPQGAPGYTPVKFVDYWTDADQESIVQQVIAALGTPVFGRVDEDCKITLTGELVDGKTYTFAFVDEDGGETVIGTYTKNNAPDYTNQIAISTDADGNVYNGTGYKVGYRLNSSGEEDQLPTTATNPAFITGFIPIKSGDVVRMKDCYIDTNNVDKTSTYGKANWSLYINYFTSDRAHKIKTEWNNMHTSKFVTDLVLDAGGYCTGFTFTSEIGSNSIAYVRLCLAGTPETAVVTINEAIE